MHVENIYPPPQLHGRNFGYTFAPRLNVGFFEAPHLSNVMSLPSNPSSLLASQLAAQFAAQDRLLGLGLLSPIPQVRGRTPARVSAEARPPPPPGRPGLFGGAPTCAYSPKIYGIPLTVGQRA